jgi:gliding motility-associated-like protein
MKTIFFLIVLIMSLRGFPQCPFPVTINSSGNNCLGVTLSVSTGNLLSQIVWDKDGSAVSTATTTSNVDIITVAGGNGQGSAANQFFENGPIYFDKNGNLYVVDVGAASIQEWAPGATSGITVAGGNGYGSAANQLNGPGGIYVDAAGDIYIADEYNERVQKWATGASVGITVAGGNGAGSASNQFDAPLAVFLDGAGNLYVADGINERIQKWAPGAVNGVTVAGGNGEGSAANQFNGPGGIFIDGSGNIFVCDLVNNRVQKWTPGATTGITVAGGNGLGSAANQLYYPDAVYVDGAENIYVGDLGNFRIQEWTPGATSGITVAGGSSGSAANEFNDIEGLWVDASGDIFISDNLNYRVQEWASLKGINTSYTPLLPGTYTAAVTDNAGCTVTTDAFVIDPIVTPSLSINTPTLSVCQGTSVTFTTMGTNGGSDPAFQWQVNGTAAGNNSSTFTDPDLLNGDLITCIMTSDAACVTTSVASSNTIQISINTDVAPAVKITSSADTICSGKRVDFEATLSNGGTSPSYQWQVNGGSAGSDNSLFSSNSISNGDIVTCIVTNNGVACGPSSSNDITITVNPTPSIPSGQVFVLPQGQDIILSPGIIGDIASYLWTPGTRLSDSTIENPLANPLQTTLYRLQVTTAYGCQAIGDITVKVSTQLRIPNAFTPNGDGRNDIFYIMGGQAGSLVQDLSIFNRWGQKIFQVHNVPPDDPAFGWDGTINGIAAPAGNYVYIITMKTANVALEVSKGTILLLR